MYGCPVVCAVGSATCNENPNRTNTVPRHAGAKLTILKLLDCYQFSKLISQGVHFCMMEPHTELFNACIQCFGKKDEMNEIEK